MVNTYEAIGLKPLETVRLNFKRDRGFVELGSELLDHDLRADIIKCILAQKEAATASILRFRPEKDALKKVSERALDDLIRFGHDVHGIATERSISNVISFGAKRVQGSIQEQNVTALRTSVDAKLGSVAKDIFGEERGLNVVGSGHFWYPPGSYMGWHTNSGAPGWRIYVNYAEEEGKSFIRYRDPDSEKIVTLRDRQWNVRVFRIEPHRHLWHAIYSDTNRFSFGYMVHKRSLGTRVRSRLLRLLR